MSNENKINVTAGDADVRKKESKVGRFFITLLWLIISVGVDVFAVMSASFIVGAVIELVFAIITFCVPYLRKKGSYTRWFGFLALISAVGLFLGQFGL